ncbi:MAG: YdcF family protein [Tyzzerella sp.]|uniref:YdcF family protein n=1 Tax=Candidatus Fimicola merdigallinarum TaxID=2840819 RepID=A0A9D9DWI2_9FIRM|nr:YdcF family protein [Candidatus Fimicola merdigallinarum]
MIIIIRFIAIFLGLIGILNSKRTLKISNGNLGTYLPSIIGIMLIIFGIFKPQIDKLCQLNIVFYILINSIYFIFSIFLITFILCTAFLHFKGEKKPPSNCDAVIVLGAGLNGYRVSKSLAYRLDKAFEYATENKNCVIVVSGGQGKDEYRTESSAMKEYLINMGIKKDRILEEDKSTRTVENFKFSKDILDNYFKKHYSVVFVTNDFHIFRAGLIAKKFGITAYGLGSKSYKKLLFNFYLREYFSIIKFFIVDR